MNQKLYEEINKIFNVDIREQTKKQPTATARQLYFYIRKTTTKLSLAKIGKEMKRDHATVIWAIQRIEEILTKPQDPWHRQCIKIVQKFDKDHEELTLAIENEVLRRRVEKLEKRVVKSQVSKDLQNLFYQIKETPEENQLSIVLRLEAILRMEKSKVMKFNPKKVVC